MTVPTVDIGGVSTGILSALLPLIGLGIMFIFLIMAMVAMYFYSQNKLPFFKRWSHRINFWAARGENEIDLIFEDMGAVIQKTPGERVFALKSGGTIPYFGPEHYITNKPKPLLELIQVSDGVFEVVKRGRLGFNILKVKSSISTAFRLNKDALERTTKQPPWAQFVFPIMLLVAFLIIGMVIYLIVGESAKTLGTYGGTLQESTKQMTYACGQIAEQCLKK